MVVNVALQPILREWAGGSGGASVRVRAETGLGLGQPDKGERQINAFQSVDYGIH